MVLANAIAYIDTILARGRLGIDDFAHAIAGVNFALGRDFFENIAQVRAARRMWYKLLTERYKAKNPRSLRLRIHSLTQGSHWTYEQPLNNIIRGTYRALSAALGGVQSLGVSAYDEALSTPSEEAHVLSIRTQQILQLESNVTSVVDPFAGSYYIEWLTNEMEKQGWEYLKRIEELGGYVGVLDSGWAHREAAKGAMIWEKKIASGETKVVGVNCFRLDQEPHTVSPFRPNPKAWEISMARLEQIRKERDNNKVKQALDKLRRATTTEKNIMPAVIDVARAYGTIGEVGKIWRDVFGTWDVPTLF
jgi:methylmalonyl-CoA mutase N-terminal domain/subunit